MEEKILDVIFTFSVYTLGLLSVLGFVVWLFVHCTMIDGILLYC